uniref:Uncharacterized protein n=1 Tax=mine drainage metagenome TaxID=410659 RepID=E6Q6R6_9ZZZZ
MLNAHVKMINDQLLQWGRDVIVAEIQRLVSLARPTWRLQWGRDVIVAEIR